MIVAFLFEIYGIENPSYIDIGAHHPYYYSNTAHFYMSGCRGINIEPNPELFKEINEVRTEDVNLNIGIGDEEGVLDFYVMNVPSMSTFSKEIADELVQKQGFILQDVLKIEVQRLDSVIQKYHNGIFPDYLSLDTEGYDLSILKTIDYDRAAPKVICVETVEYSHDLNGRKEKEIIDFLSDEGYRVFADTYMNTIFMSF